MATPRRARAPGRMRTRLLALCLAVAGAALVLPDGASAAAPSESIAQVQQQIDRLNNQVNLLAEAYDAAQIRLTATELQAAEVQRQLRRALRSTAVLRARLDAIAAAAYRSGTASPFLSLLSTSDPQTFLDQAQALDQLSRDQRGQILNLLSAQQGLRAARAVVARQLAVQRAAQQRLAADRNQIETALAAEKSVLAQLTAAQQAALAAQQARAAAAAAASRSAWRAPLYTGPATGQAAAAVRFAYAQLGKPYQWGAAGPDSYDCSGLTMAAWAAGGVSLPHNAAMQQSDIPSVSPGALEPGDLLFFGVPAYHVGMYVGNGQMIDAPHTGATVELVGAGGFSSAGRP